jgi:predicted acylesterase/phospholipase RssA
MGGAQRWWENLPVGNRWAGAFQGGGARGIAYAGALAAFEAKGHWFSAVAGSSAGALTATLVACGYHPDDLPDLTRYLLDGVEVRGRAGRALARLKVPGGLLGYDSRGLEARIEAIVQAALDHYDQAGSPTFASLHSATGIELFVVGLDTTTGQPVVFSAARTPDLPVAASIVASCSIPIAFDPLTLQGNRELLGASLMGFHNVVDGGAFANLPHFVFTDEAARAALGINGNDGRLALFTLSGPRSLTSPRRWVEVKPTPNGAISAFQLRRTLSRNREGSLEQDCRCVDGVNQAVSVDRHRRGASIVRALAAPVVLLAFIAAWGLGSWWVFERTGLVGRLALAVAWVLAFVVTWLAVRLGRAVSLAGVPTIKAIVGTATGAPFWVGHVPGILVLFIDAPGLKTTGFNPSKEVVDCVVDVARRTADSQLDLFLETGQLAFAANLANLQEAASSHGLELSSLDSLVEDRDHGRKVPEPPVRSR